jgi:peptidoglycan/LPS O-acetylase OafA/YrhL
LSTGAVQFRGLFRWFVVATYCGWAGVNLFFVLSGFLITGILLKDRNDSDYYRNFYMRRALRILPAYYAVLVLLLVLARTGAIERHASWSFLGLSFIYLANMTELFGVPGQYSVLWSLAVEEHFYFLWPAVVRSASRRLLPWICVLIIFLCPVERAYYYWHHYEYGAGYTWLVADGLAWGALLGVLARASLSTRPAMFRLGLACLLGSAAAIVALLPLGVGTSGSFVGGVLRLSLVNSFFAGVLALSLVAGSGPWRAVFDRPVLRFLGEISYGLYLIHMLAFGIVDKLLGRWGLHLSRTSGGPVLLLARFAAAVALSTAIAYLSRWYYEEPFLRLKNKFSVRTLEYPDEVLKRA